VSLDTPEALGIKSKLVPAYRFCLPDDKVLGRTSGLRPTSSRNDTAEPQVWTERRLRYPWPQEVTDDRLVRSSCVHRRSGNHNRHDPPILLVAAIIYENLFDIILCFLIGRDLSISIDLAFARIVGSQG
jgi:hypothetical protein